MPQVVELKYTNPSLFLLRDGIMTPHQISFYHYFKSEISRGRRIELLGNKGYVILLINEYLEELNNITEGYFTRKSGNKKSPYSSSATILGPDILKLKPEYQNCLFPIDDTIQQLTILDNLYDFSEITNYIGDVYCFGGRFQDALNTYKIDPQQLNAHRTNKILNIKTMIGAELTAKELLCVRKKITKFGEDNFDMIVEFADIALNEDTKSRGENYLKYINRKYKTNRGATYGDFQYWRIFYDDGGAGTDLRKKFLGRFKVKTYSYYQIPEFIKYCNDLSRKAENLYRKSLKLPNVGEGWLAETELYYKIKNYLPKIEVLQHASPDWLGKQHLDIFIPKLNLAFEYHGKQHFEPVALFGGQEGFANTQKRDKIKREKCKANRVMLIEVIEGYDFNDIIKAINTFKNIFKE